MTNQPTPSLVPPRRRYQAAQSLTVAIIVLFLLLFLGGLFIALIVNNMRATSTAAKGSAADKLAEAGVKYLDDELTKSPEGADWRPVPFVADPDDATTTAEGTTYNDQDSDGDGIRNAEPLRLTDPDYDWLRPCKDSAGATINPEPCGYSRVDFGGRTPSAGNLGGRALIKIDYKPDNAATPAAERSATKPFLKLLSIGRAGIVDPDDPTTFSSSEGKGARRETSAFKQIGTVEFLRHITNKDNRSVIAGLGTGSKVLDSDYIAGGRNTNPPSARQIESVYHGPIHSNAALTFYGSNRLLLNGQRGDALTVSSTLNIPANNSQVLLTEVGGAFTNASVAASNAVFNSYQGLVRDHAPQTSDPLRRVARTTAPLIDQSIGDNGLTRYRALTLNSQPMDARFVGPTNPLGNSSGFPFSWTTANNPTLPGRLGWGSGLYLDNREDMQNASEGLIGAYSPRANWVGVDRTWWNGDNRYVPPAVVITLTPRYMIIQRSATSVNRSFLRDNTGRRINQTTVVRYSGLGTGAADAQVPGVGLPATVRKLEGYPATPDATLPGVWRGEYVVYAEGNVRIRGTVGGLDPETARYFIRNLTVVSGGNIYIDGNLLKDNISDNAVGTAGQVRGKSSIALLAKNYVVLNTTQFFSPGDNAAGPEASGSDARAIFLNPASPSFAMRLNQAPVQQWNAAGAPTKQVAPREALATYTPQLYLRHSAAGVDGATAIRLGINTSFFQFPADVAWPNANPAGTTLAMGGPTSIEPGIYFDHVFDLNQPQLYPDITAPYTQVPDFGIDNLMSLSVDPSAGVPNQTDYRLSRAAIAPADIRVEALLYAQEGSFFIIPGPWFNPDPNDTYENYIALQRRPGDNLLSTGVTRGRIDPRFPFYGQPMDIRITLFGAITENMPAEVGDQGAWLEKWGWIPHYYGSTGLPAAPGYDSRYATSAQALLSLHGANGPLRGPQPGGAGNGGDSGIVYLYDDKLVSPYDANNQPLRQDAYKNILPVAPRLPVAPGLLYAGETPGA